MGGTALAKVLADAGNGVTLWTRRPELAEEINATHRSPFYLGGDTVLPESIRATCDPAEALDGACTVLLGGCRHRRCGPISSTGST